MIALTDKQFKTFTNEYSEKFFILFLTIGSLDKNYSHDNVSIYDATKNSWFNFIGSFVNDIKLDLSYKSIDNSYNVPNINISIIDYSVDFIRLSKELAINFSEFKLYFATNELSIDEALPLFQGTIGIDTIDIIGNPINMTFLNVDNKYDKIFPPIVLSTSSVWANLLNDAEKYTGESVPIIYGFLDFPGVPIPLCFDDITGSVKYTIANHALGLNTAIYYTNPNCRIFADGIEVTSTFWTASYNSTYNITFLTVTRLNYNTYFKGKKITCACGGLLYNVATPTYPSIGQVVLHMLQNYSGLTASLIDLQKIADTIIYLSSYKVARFFNSSSTVFETIKELSLEFPFLFTNSGFAKTVTCTDYSNIPFTYELSINKVYLERVKGIKISKVSELFNKFSARYKYDALNNRWKGFAYYDSTNNSDCANLKTKIGDVDKEKPALELYSVSDLATAQNILLAQIKKFSIPKFQIVYKCKHNSIGLELGDGLYLTDEEINIIRKKFIVTGKLIGRDFIYLTVENAENLI